MTVIAKTAVAVLFAAVASTATAATPWTSPSGSTTGTTYTNGQTDAGLFTDTGPTVSGNTFQFTPNNFSATAYNGTQTTTDTTSFLLTAKPGQTITNISASITGDWSVLTLSSVSARVLPAVVTTGVNAAGTLTLTNPVTHAVVSKSFDFSGQFVGEDGTFADSIALPAGWKSAQVSLSASVTASADSSSTSFIQLKGAAIGVETTPTAVPLPGAALAAIPGIAIAYYARRKMKR